MSELVSTESKPLASISMDLDNQWSYMRTHGDPGWESFPSYFDVFIPYVLDILDRLNLRITFFVVGQDAALDRNREVLKLLTDRGHEVGNHSFNHEPWLHLYSKDQIEKEVLDAEAEILRVTGNKPVGFRGPGFSWSPALIEVLAENDYLYDASSLPTYLGTLARAYYFRKTRLTKEKMARRKKLFGNFRDGFRPNKPYTVQSKSLRKLVEIPVTTMPLVKTPIHLSYLLYLGRFSVPLMSVYFRTALTLCRLNNIEPSFLLHPLDLLNAEQVPEISFFPAMDLDTNTKDRIFEKVLKQLKKHYTLVNITTHISSLVSRNEIKDTKRICATVPLRTSY